MNTISKETYQRRLNQLIKEVATHTYKSELLNIMEEQVLETRQDLEGLYTDGQFLNSDC
jgi:hypothetical protein